MNFLKIFYLTATLLGCVNLIAMQEVPSDEELQVSINQIVQHVRTYSTSQNQLFKTDQLNSTDVSSIPLEEIINSDVFSTWFNCAIQYIGKKFSEKIQISLIIANTNSDCDITHTHGHNERCYTITITEHFLLQSVVTIRMLLLQEIDQIFLKHTYARLALQGITPAAVKTSIQQIIEHSSKYLGRHPVDDPGDLTGDDLSKNFIAWVYSLILSKYTKFILPHIVLTQDEKIDLRATSRIPHLITVSIGALKKLSLPELQYGIAHELGHIYFDHSTMKLLYDDQLSNNSFVSRTIQVLYLLQTLRFTTGRTLRLPPCAQACLNLTRFLFEEPLAITLKTIYNFCEYRVSRRHEYEADAFAIELTHDLEASQNALLKMREDYSDTHTGWRYELRNLLGFDTHPHYKDRIAHMKKIICELKKQD